MRSKTVRQEIYTRTWNTRKLVLAEEVAGEKSMLLESSNTGIRQLLTGLSISAVVFAGHANGQAPQVETPSAGSSSSQTPGEWVRYSIEGGEFSVLLPTTPAMTTYEVRVDPFSKNRVRHIVSAYSQGVVYAVFVSERKLSLEEFISASRYSCPNDSKRDVKIGRAHV